MKSICFAAGKSGGHIVPCLTLAKKYSKQHNNLHITFISAQNKLDQKLTNDDLINKNIYLKLDNVPYKQFFHWPLFFLQLTYSWIKITAYFIKKRPERIISTGSYIAIPAVLAAFTLRIPIELWELNVIPGKAIKWLTPFANTVNITFTETKQYLPNFKCTETQYPIRYEQKLTIPQQKSRKLIDLHENLFTIFIMGGSQGSRTLNQLIKKLIESHPELRKKIQCIHQTGPDPYDWKAWYQKQNIPAVIFTYKNNLSDIYNATDLIISRAGAGALAEIDFFKKRAIIFPLKTNQTDHQHHNANAMQRQSPQLFTILNLENENCLQQISRYIFLQL